MAAVAAVGVSSFQRGVSRGGVTKVRLADRQSRTVDERAELLERFRRFRKESQSYFESLGYTEETFMEMVDEEVRACRIERAALKAHGRK